MTNNQERIKKVNFLVQLNVLLSSIEKKMVNNVLPLSGKIPKEYIKSIPLYDYVDVLFNHDRAKLYVSSTSEINLNNIESNFQTVNRVTELANLLRRTATVNTVDEFLLLEKIIEQFSSYIQQLKTRDDIIDLVTELQNIIKLGEAFLITKEIDREYGNNLRKDKFSITEYLLSKNDALTKKESPENCKVTETVFNCDNEVMSGSNDEANRISYMNKMFTEKLARCHIDAVHNTLKTISTVILKTKIDNCDFAYRNDYIINEIIDLVDDLLSTFIIEYDEEKIADNIDDFIVDILHTPSSSTFTLET